MVDRLGNAAITWAATSDSNSKRVHLLQAPLRQIKAGHSMRTFKQESLDRSVFERVAIGDGAPELIGAVRYDHDPEGLIDVIVAGSQGKTLTYTPDLTDPDVFFACDLISPDTPTALTLDPTRGILGDQTVELRLRLTTQGPFDPLYHGTAVLFSYRAGGSLEQSSSFGRITNSTAPATYPSNTGGGGYGTLTTAASNEARIAWFADDSTVGPRTFPALLLEDTREQLISQTENFGATTWSQTAGPTITSGQADPYGGNEAWLIEDNNTVNQALIFTQVDLSSAGQPVISLFVKEGTTQAATTRGSQLALFSSGSTNAIAIEFAFSSGEPAPVVVVGSTLDVGLEKWRDGWWRIDKSSSANLSSGEAWVYRIFPAVTSTDIGDLYIFGANLEINT